MGTWGTAIFADDLAADVRGDWRDALMDGLSAEEATARMLTTFSDAAADPDDGPRFWMALAAAQSETGRLQDSVRDRALAVIESGADVEQFERTDQGRRRKAITELARKLQRPQRAPVTLKRPRPQPSPAAVGDVVRVRGERRTALFVVVDLAKGWPPGSQWPVAAGLRAPEPMGNVPGAETLTKLPLVRDHRMGPLRPVVGDPVVSYYVVSGPARGPRAFANFADVVAQGIRRPDAPAVPQGHSSAAQVAFIAWQGLAHLVDGEWYERMLAVTDAYEARQSGGWRSVTRQFTRRPPST